MDLDLRITEKQDLFIHSEAFETLFGGWKVLLEEANLMVS
jgi:hypothetical protein